MIVYSYSVFVKVKYRRKKWRARCLCPVHLLSLSNKVNAGRQRGQLAACFTLCFLLFFLRRCAVIARYAVFCVRVSVGSIGLFCMRCRVFCCHRVIVCACAVSGCLTC